MMLILRTLELRISFSLRGLLSIEVNSLLDRSHWIWPVFQLILGLLAYNQGILNMISCFEISVMLKYLICFILQTLNGIEKVCILTLPN
jgi:hypothetical protein